MRTRPTITIPASSSDVLAALAAATGSVSVNSQKITNLAAGTSASDAARLDQAVLTPTAVQTADYTAVWGELVMVDTTAGAVQITLPTAVGAKGKRIGVKRTAGTNNVTFATTGGQTIDGVAASSSAIQFLGIFPASGASTTFVSDDANIFRLQAPANLVSTASTSATVDNTIARMDGTGGRAIQASGITIDDSDRIGFGTTAPTHTTTHASTSTGTAHYNTADQVTDYERFRIFWSSNQIVLGSEAGGAGTFRNIRISVAGTVNYTQTTAGHSFTGNIAAANTPLLSLTNAASLTSTTAVQPFFQITGTVNQTSGSGGADVIDVNPTLTAVGSAGANLLRLRAGSVDKFRVDSNGKVTADATLTAGGTTGAQTINKPAGSVNFAAAATSLVVTNSRVSTSSLVFACCATNDTTAYVKNVVPGSGSFTINLGAAATAETKVIFWVLN